MFSSDEAKVRIAKVKAKEHEAKLRQIAELAHRAANARGSNDWITAIVQIRTMARTALGLPVIPQGLRGDER